MPAAKGSARTPLGPISLIVLVTHTALQDPGISISVSTFSIRHMLARAGHATNF